MLMEHVNNNFITITNVNTDCSIQNQLYALTSIQTFCTLWNVYDTEWNDQQFAGRLKKK